MCEYNHAIPVAIVEYKERHAALPNFNHPTYLAVKELADGYRNPLPFLVAIYNTEDASFRVLPVNLRARDHYAHCLNKILSEQRFVRSLYLLRKKALNQQDEIRIGQLNDLVLENWTYKREDIT